MTLAAHSQWEETTLGEVIEIYDHKRIPLSSRERRKRPGPYPYYGASGIIDYIDDYLFDGRYLLIAEDGENLNTRKTPIAFFASGKFWVNTHAHIVRAKSGLADDYFLMSHFEATDISGYITGTAQPKLSQTNLKAIRLRLPPLPTQRKIAAILSAYDDLIENNTRRIAILEEMAQLIYREWFVHFRCPGHEGVPLVDSDLGPIPEGWEVAKVGSVSKINASSIRKGGAPDQINYVNISAVSTGQIEQVEPMAFGDAPSRARRVVSHGDIIWSTVRPNRRSYCLILDPMPNMIVSTGFAVITARNVPYTYLYHALTTDEFTEYLTNHATGAAYPAVNTKDFENADVLVPPWSVLERFDDIATAIVSHKQNLGRRNGILRQTRDLLLPRLVSGKIDVSELDIDTGGLNV